MYHMIINPASRSGRGKQYWTILENYLNDHNINYTAHISQKLGHVTEIMRELTRSLDSNSEPIKVIVLGGDGTVNEALQGICNFEKVHFSYIPTCSSNDFARNFNISKDPIVNLEHILYSSQEKVIDLGKDVDTELIIDTAIKENAGIIALSALMTTTMKEMEEVVKLAKERKCKAQIMIGGAVITQEYADEIGAEGYSTDASDAVKCASRLLNILK